MELWRSARVRSSVRLPPTSAAATAALALALALAAAAPTRADVALPPPVASSLEVRHVRAVDVRAPREDRDRAIRDVRATLYGFRARIDRCLADRGARLGGGRLRARVRWSRSELPERTEVVENQLGAAAAACVAEVLPSLLLRPAPRGDLTLELVLGASYVRPWAR